MQDIKITVYNDTDEFHNIVIFQPEDELNIMLNNEHLFPLAWEVFPLAAQKEKEERCGITLYSSILKIGITYSISHRDMSNSEAISDDFCGGKLIIKREAMNGDIFQYRIDRRGGQYIDKLDDKNDDGSISCQNKFPDVVSIDLYNNDNKLVKWQDLSNGDWAKFKLKNILYFMSAENVRKGQKIDRHMISYNPPKKIDLAGYSHINMRLTYDLDEGGKKKKWVVQKR